MFHFAGDGDLNRVRRFISEKNLSLNVHLLGWLNFSQKLEVLHKVETLILPSYIEGLPMSIIEAMASGKVIVSTDVGGIPDIVENFENGFLFKPGDCEKIVELILYVNHNPQLMNEIKDNNISRISNQYSIEQSILRLKNLYDQVAESEIKSSDSLAC